LSDAAEKVEHQPSIWGRSVDRLIQHLERYALGFKARTYLAKMRNAPDKPVEFAANENVTLSHKVQRGL
jgi:hypothetical protein